MQAIVLRALLPCPVSPPESTAREERRRAARQPVGAFSSILLWLLDPSTADEPRHLPPPPSLSSLSFL